MIVLAQTYTGTWVCVKTAPVGDTLTVKLRNGKTIKDEKQDATDTSLSLLRMGQTI